MSDISYRRILDKLDRVREVGNRATALCPAHPDHNPSLSITRTEGRTLVYCHAGCDTDHVLDAIGLTMADLFDQPFTDNRYGSVLARYEYPRGRVVYRTADKQFPQPNRACNADTSLYHGDRIADVDVVYVVEGEEDVHAVEAVGGIAVCSAMGAGKADKFDWTPLAGKHAVIVADRDKPGRKHAARVAELLRPLAASVRVVEPAVGKDASDHIAAGKSLADLVEPTPAPPVSLISLSEVKPEQVEWLWPGYLPRGKLVTLDGDPGLGKSTLALTFAAPASTGGRWPGGSRCEHPGAVLLLSAEDGLADTVRPRLDAAGADVTKVHAIQGVPMVDDDGNIGLRPPTLGDIDSLQEAINQTGAVLLIVDVLMAYMPSGSDAHKDQDVRAILSRLTRLAEETGCTIVLLRHLNKSTGRDPLYRGGGSIGIVGAGRLALVVAADPDDEDRRVLAAMKSNLGPMPPALAYRLVASGDYGVARIEWDGPVGHTARALLNEPPTAEEASAMTEAQLWLEDYLMQNGSTKSSEAKNEARKVRISERTLQRAAEKLGVVARSEGFPRVTFWSLPVNPTITHTRGAGATGTTGPDQQESDGATGLKTQSRQGLYDGATAMPKEKNDHPLAADPASKPAPVTAHQAGLFAAYPPCFHCDKPVIGKYLDADNRYVHHECEKKNAPSAKST